MVCAIFDESAEYGKKITDEKSLLQQTFEFVMNEFDSDCSLKTLAARLGYNYSYLSRYFKNAVGMSFNSYVNTYRLNNACYLLRNTENTAVELLMLVIRWPLFVNSFSFPVQTARGHPTRRIRFNLEITQKRCEKSTFLCEM